MKKRIFCLTAVIFLFCSLVFSSVTAAVYSELLPRIIDEASLLTSSEKELLNERIKNEILSVYSFDTVILTTANLDGKLIEDYANDFYDFKGYGVNDSYDGIILVISVAQGERGYAMSASGYGQTVFTDYGIDYIGSEIKPFLSSEKYNDAFDAFIDKTVMFLKQAQTGSPFDYNNKVSELKNKLPMFLIAIGIAFIIALISVLTMKSKMNTARPQPGANEYVKRGSLNMTHKSDTFLYSNTVKKAKPKDNSGPPGGTTKTTGSSGRSHSSGSGKF